MPILSTSLLVLCGEDGPKREASAFLLRNESMQDDLNRPYWSQRSHWTLYEAQYQGYKASSSVLNSIREFAY
jgi:hypothetical protein